MSSYKHDDHRRYSHEINWKDRKQSRSRDRYKGNDTNWRERSRSDDRFNDRDLKRKERSRSNDRIRHEYPKHRERSSSTDRLKDRNSKRKGRSTSNDSIKHKGRERSRSNDKIRGKIPKRREGSSSNDRYTDRNSKREDRSRSNDSVKHKDYSRKDKLKSRSRDRSSEKSRCIKSPDRRSDNDSKRETKRSNRGKKSGKAKKKSKKKKSSDSSPSSSSSESNNSSNSDDSSASTSSAKLMKLLHEQRIRMIEEKKKQKELMKLNETPEEKRLRRIKKKEAKELKRKERMGWDSEYLHYTNTDNPFGDGNLLSTFVWTKKLDKEGLSGVSRDELEIRNRQKQEENKRELEKVKKRRLERELERQQREEEMALLQRSKEAAQFQEWERQEDQFHLEQARLRSKIRMQDSRAKPIDLLARYIGAEEEVDAVEMHEPYTYLNGLSAKDLEDLIEDIKVYKELERGRNLDYWHDITVIVEDELHKLRKLERQGEYEAAVGRREGIHQSVAKDVASVFRGKTAAQLQELQTQIEAKISKKTEGVDIGYWESLLSQLKAHMARARLRDRHQENLRKKLEMLKAEQGVSATTTSAEGSSFDARPGSSSAPDSGSGGAGPSGTSRAQAAQMKQEADDESGGERSESEEEDTNETPQDGAAREMLNESFADYQSGGYSPKYLTPSQLEPGTLIVSEEDDMQRLEFARAQILRGVGGRVENVITAEEQELQRQARKGMEGDEAEFSVESSLDSQVYLWSDKYRPRKPRYFNRVHTGFEWNKYNQTHYDMDNPPPKIVQGYKFNIFYPDLIDKSSTPQYFLTPCPDNRDFAILRFHAGPPYEDIAFKIVNREWEYSYKRGFRCQFHNNIFQLWFHFKRYRYRR